MRHILTAAALAAALVGFAPGSASSAKPSTCCPNANSGYVLVDRDEWMVRTLAGFAAEGIVTAEELDAAAVAFGFEDWDALAAWIVGEQWDGFDHNRNGLVCMKNLPHTPGIPAYVFGGIDDQSSSKG